MSATTLRRLIVVTLIALWELLPRSGLIPELFLPALSSTLVAGWNEAGEYGHALAVTLYEVAVSMVFACGGGILLGAIVGSLPRPRILIMPMVSSLYAVPLVILYPVFTVWLGIGSESKIAFASIYGFLPTMLATAAGIQTRSEERRAGKECRPRGSAEHAEDGIRDGRVTGVQTCALPISAACRARAC